MTNQRIEFRAGHREALIGHLIDQGLSPQQAYVTYGRMEGKTLPDIATEMGISANTAIYHHQKANVIMRHVRLPSCNDCIHCTYCEDYMFIPSESAAVCENLEGQ